MIAFLRDKSPFRRLTRALTAAVCLILIVFLFSGCAGDGSPDSSDGSSAGSGTAEQPDIRVSLAGYRIVRPDGGDGMDEAISLYRELDKLGTRLDIVTDWHKKDEALPAQAKEILVGRTNRSESEEVYRDLKLYDSAVLFVPESGRIVIAGGNAAALASAVEDFLASVSSGSFPGDLSVKRSGGEYRLRSLTLNGIPAGDYSIVTGKGADNDLKYAASIISSAVADACGAMLSVSAEADPSKKGAIVLSKSKTFCVTSSEGAVTISAPGGDVVRAARLFVEAMIPADASGDRSFDVSQYEFVLPALTEFTPPDELGELPVALADQQNACAVFYDIAPLLRGGEPVLKYTFKPSSSLGFSADSTYGNRIDEIKMFYDEKSDRILMGFTSSSGYIGIAEYPSGKKVFETKLKGWGPHSCAWLGDGIFAAVMSGNGDNDKAYVRIWDINSADSSPLASYALAGAHAAVWDGSRGLLFVLGTSKITALEHRVTGKAHELKEISIYTSEKSMGGHDLSPFAGNPDSLLVSGTGTFYYNVTTGEISSKTTEKLGTWGKTVKCFCSTVFEGKTVFLRTTATGVYASHDTDRFDIFTVDGTEVKKTTAVFTDRAFYKARAVGG